MSFDAAHMPWLRYVVHMLRCKLFAVVAKRRSKPQ